VSTFAPVDYPPRLGLHRAQVMVVHPIHYGVMASMLFSLAFVGLKGQMPDVARFVLAAALAVCCFLSVSSGAVLALALQMGLIGYVWATRGLARPWTLLLVGIGVMWVFVWVYTGHFPIKVVLSKLTFNPQTAYWRATLLDHGVQNLNANPVFGLGLRDWSRPDWVVSGSLDNFWLLQGMRYGYPGLILVTGAFLSTVIALARRPLGSDPQLSQIKLSWMLMMSGTIFSLVTVHVWATLLALLFFLLGAGHWLLDPSVTVAGQASEAAGPEPKRARHAQSRRRRPEHRAEPAGTVPAAEPETTPAATTGRVPRRYSRWAPGEAPAPRAGAPRPGRGPSRR